MKNKGPFWLVLAAGALADQVTKVLAFRYLDDSHTLIPWLLDLTTSENQGALFGMMAGRGLLLAAISLAALGLIVWFLYRAPSQGKWLPVALGFVGAGALGNFIDRAFNNGKVRDFIDLHAGRYHWPTFNLADAFICIGVGMVIYAEFKAKSTGKTS